MALAEFEGNLPYHPFGSRTLRLTAPPTAGTDVKVLQDVYDLMLQVMNPPDDPVGSPVLVDGVFGAETQRAVREVQSYFGLTVDGEVGPETYLLFGQPVGRFLTYGGPAFGSRSLAQGAAGGDVIVLQNRLNCFRCARSLGGPATRTYGASTSAAVLDSQMDANANGDAGVPLSGDVGPETFDALWIYTFAGGRNLRRGDRGFDVAWVQLFLSTRTSSRGSAYFSGPIDGCFNTRTMEAVRLWQADNGIAETGVVNPATYFSIGFNNPNRAPAPAPLPSVPRPMAFPCCVTLERPADIAPRLPDAAGAALTRSLTSGQQAVSVLAAGLPAPSTFIAFDSYEGFVSTPGVGGYGFLLFPTPQTPLTWAGTIEFWTNLTVQSQVIVHPVNTRTGTSGPTVLAGTLRACAPPTAQAVAAQARTMAAARQLRRPWWRARKGPRSRS